MRTPIRKFVALLAIAAVLVSVGLTPASAATQVPFKARAAGSFTFVGDPPSPSGLILDATGIATHLGQSTSHGVMTFLPDAASCPGGFKIDDEETLTATDDGDQITISVDDEACPTGTPNVYQISATYTVTGGTGSFASAGGQGTAECIGDFNNNTFASTLKGTISRPNGG